MPYKIRHAQQVVQNYFAALMMQPVTQNCNAELLCSVFSFVLFLPDVKNLNYYYFLYSLL